MGLDFCGGEGIEEEKEDSLVLAVVMVPPELGVMEGVTGLNIISGT
jgi:hypothetical protein